MLRAVLGFTALLLLLSLGSFHPLDPHPFTQGAAVAAVQNLCGTVGATLAGLLQTVLGVGAWIVPPYLLWEAWPRADRQWPGRTAWLGLALSLWTALGAFGDRVWTGLPEGGIPTYRWGGWVGSALWPLERRFLGPVGLPLLLAAVVLVCALVLAPALTRGLGRLLSRWLGERAWPWVILRTLDGRAGDGGAWVSVKAVSVIVVLAVRVCPRAGLAGERGCVWFILRTLFGRMGESCPRPGVRVVVSKAAAGSVAAVGDEGVSANPKPFPLEDARGDGEVIRPLPDRIEGDLAPPDATGVPPGEVSTPPFLVLPFFLLLVLIFLVRSSG